MDMLTGVTWGTEGGLALLHDPSQEPELGDNMKHLREGRLGDVVHGPVL